MKKIMSRTCVKVNYHNWRHAFNVCQLMFAILTSTTWWNHFGEVEVLIVLFINITVRLIIVKRDSDFSNSDVFLKFPGVGDGDRLPVP